MTIIKRKSRPVNIIVYLFMLVILFNSCNEKQPSNKKIRLNDRDYFETRGLNILVFSNWYNENFDDSKMSGIEIIQHDVRVATNGDVRLNPTPGQWDPIPVFIGREVNKESQSIEARMKYTNYNFEYKIKVCPEGDGVCISILIDSTLPDALKGIAGFNLEFLPSVYWEKSYLIDDSIYGIFPLYPEGSMEIDTKGIIEPKPLAQGKSITLAPEDPEHKVTLTSETDILNLYDGRNKAQNGWYVVRTLIPSGKTGEVIRWHLSAHTIDSWLRSPVIGYSQVGYSPNQNKTAVIELDKNDKPLKEARIININSEGSEIVALIPKVNKWGEYLRYIYYTADFTEIKKEGLYIIEYGKTRTKPFRIEKDIYSKVWQPTLDVFLPVQMDHMLVNEAYRVWHGASHLDDALQAPVNHKHFDMYAQGNTTDTRFKPGEHIPGLNIGGWFDAGDFDIRTQSQYATIFQLINTWELFKPKRDETTIDQASRYVDIHHPDGKPDLLQQIEHGTIALIAQHRAVGFAINGIIAAHLHQYNHLGDAINKTDNLIYNSSLDSLEKRCNYSGTFDDRWAFTSRSTPLNYGSAAALAAASRVLKGYNDELADECLSTAIKVWDEEHSHEPYLFKHGNTTGGKLEDEELKAACELLITTKDNKFATRITELWNTIEKGFFMNASLAVRILPFMDNSFHEKIKGLTILYRDSLVKICDKNPYGVPISNGGWAGNGWVLYSGITNYWLHTAFPDIINKEHILKSLNYIYGCHPGSNISFVSGVGTVSKKIAYGNNRADFSFIAGGVVPGILILPPDFPENKEDWPFLWGENEYVITLGAAHIFLAHAANDVIKE